MNSAIVAEQLVRAIQIRQALRRAIRTGYEKTQEQRRDHTICRNESRGRCGSCGKKPFDCRCSK